MAQTHRDDDQMSALAELAAQMTERGENQITAGRPGEPWLVEYESENVKVRALPDDPMALRVSIGQVLGLTVVGADAYCNYRGDKAAVIALVMRALAALQARP